MIYASKQTVHHSISSTYLTYKVDKIEIRTPDRYTTDHNQTFVTHVIQSNILYCCYCFLMVQIQSNRKKNTNIDDKSIRLIGNIHHSNRLFIQMNISSISIILLVHTMKPFPSNSKVDVNSSLTYKQKLNTMYYKHNQKILTMYKHFEVLYCKLSVYFILNPLRCNGMNQQRHRFLHVTKGIGRPTTYPSILLYEQLKRSRVFLPPNY